MSPAYSPRSNPWPALIVGAVVLFALLVAWGLWIRSSRATDTIILSAPQAPEISLPRAPAVPELPDPPLPTAK